MSRELTGRHVLFILLALFGCVFAVNGVFAYFAIAGFPGLETKEPYRKGVAFNQQIEEADTLKSLGWTMSVERSESARLTLRFMRKDDTPLNVSTVAATLFHPANVKGDKALPVSMSATGVASAALDPREKGQRQLRVTARGPDGRRITFRRSVWLD